MLSQGLFAVENEPTKTACKACWGLKLCAVVGPLCPWRRMTKRLENLCHHNAFVVDWTERYLLPLHPSCDPISCKPESIIRSPSSRNNQNLKTKLPTKSTSPDTMCELIYSRYGCGHIKYWQRQVCRMYVERRICLKDEITNEKVTTALCQKCDPRSPLFVSNNLTSSRSL